MAMKLKWWLCLLMWIVLQGTAAWTAMLVYPSLEELSGFIKGCTLFLATLPFYGLGIWVEMRFRPILIEPEFDPNFDLFSK